MRRGGLVGPGSPAPRRVGGAAPAVLALHGFGGTPREVDGVVDVAAALGLAAQAPLLPGHGTRVEELAATRFADWLRGAEEAFAALASEHGRVVVVGLSMGSLLAAELALAHPEQTAALGMLANAIALHSPFPSLALRAIDRLGLADFWVPKYGADIADPAARATHLTYDAQPIHAAISVLRAGDALVARLPRIRCPALVLHGARDRVCPASNAARVARRLGSRQLRCRVLPRSRHIITRDLERREVSAELSAWLERLPRA